MSLPATTYLLVIPFWFHTNNKNSSLTIEELRVDLVGEFDVHVFRKYLKQVDDGETEFLLEVQCHGRLPRA